MLFVAFLLSLLGYIVFLYVEFSVLVSSSNCWWMSLLSVHSVLCSSMSQLLPILFWELLFSLSCVYFLVLLCLLGSAMVSPVTSSQYLRSVYILFISLHSLSHSLCKLCVPYLCIECGMVAGTRQSDLRKSDVQKLLIYLDFLTQPSFLSFKVWSEKEENI